MTPSKYVNESEIASGMTLIPDGGFLCIPIGAARTVRRDSWLRRVLPAGFLAWFGLKPASSGIGGYYVNCAHGRHYLDGQIEDEGGEIIGFHIAPTSREEVDPAFDLAAMADELLGQEVKLLAEISGRKPGEQFTVMGLENGLLRLTDNAGKVVHATPAQIEVVDW